MNIDRPDSYGDNNKFKQEAENYLNFDVNNPFGDINVPQKEYILTMDSTYYTMDSSSIKMDNKAH